jgi:hypothetical protein
MSVEAIDLEQLAQKAAEKRLHQVQDDLWRSEEDEEFEPDSAYCGCDTCAVREILDAAWPYLHALAHHPDVEKPEIPEP